MKVEIDMEEILDGLTRKQKQELKIGLATTLKKQVEDSSFRKNSAVTGTAFQKLSKAYRKRKMALGKGGQPNLHLTEQMMFDLNGVVRKNGFDLKITKAKSKKKADNHNWGRTIPKRQFLPTKDGVGFKRNIMKVLNAEIRQFKKEIE